MFEWFNLCFTNFFQTEVLITLRDTILRVGNYFYTADPNCMPEDPEFLDELQVKFMFSKKATKIDQIFTVNLTFINKVSVKSTLKIFSIITAFLENMIFKRINYLPRFREFVQCARFVLHTTYSEPPLHLAHCHTQLLA